MKSADKRANSGSCSHLMGLLHMSRVVVLNVTLVKICNSKRVPDEHMRTKYKELRMKW